MYDIKKWLMKSLQSKLFGKSRMYYGKSIPPEMNGLHLINLLTVFNPPLIHPCFLIAMIAYSEQVG